MSRRAALDDIGAAGVIQETAFEPGPAGGAFHVRLADPDRGDSDIGDGFGNGSLGATGLARVGGARPEHIHRTARGEPPVNPVGVSRRPERHRRAGSEAQARGGGLADGVAWATHAARRLTALQRV